jgi:hypothetical protein
MVQTNYINSSHYSILIEFQNKIVNLNAFAIEIISKTLALVAHFRRVGSNYKNIKQTPYGTLHIEAKQCFCFRTTCYFMVLSNAKPLHFGNHLMEKISIKDIYTSLICENNS